MTDLTLMRTEAVRQLRDVLAKRRTRGLIVSEGFGGVGRWNRR